MTFADDGLGYDDQDDDWGDDGYEADPDDYDGDDRYDEYKDDLAMGYINPDGSQREPDPPEGPDPWNWHPSLRDRIRWRISDLRRRLAAREAPPDQVLRRAAVLAARKGLNDGNESGRTQARRPDTS